MIQQKYTTFFELPAVKSIEENAWYRTFRNGILFFFAFLIGSHYEDERVTFSRKKLPHNDSYRDRLLQQEIEDLVDLCEALQLSLPQRKALFRSYLHLDFLRRSTIARRDLLRYFSLRDTLLAEFLLPEPSKATHQNTFNRWDMIQLFATCFSLCTSNAQELIQSSVQHALTSEKVIQIQNILHVTETTNRNSRNELFFQLERCMICFYGSLNIHEQSLLDLLREFYYSPADAKDTETSTKQRSIDFHRMHGVDNVFDVARLFPVLVFPCVWLQYVIKNRIMGVKVWEQLKIRQQQLAQAGLKGQFVTFTEIVKAANIEIRERNENKSSYELIWKHGRSIGRDRLSTPRKIVPSISEKIDVVDSNSVISSSDIDFKHFFSYKNTSDVWRVTGAHLMASIYVRSILSRQQKDPDYSSKNEYDAAKIFEEISKEIFAGSLSSEKLLEIRNALTTEYGYKFTQFLLEKSNLSSNSNSQCLREEVDSHTRYENAMTGQLKENDLHDRVIYWKEFLDPRERKSFYYNIRTGESVWEKPIEFSSVCKSTKKSKKKKKNDTSWF